VGRYEELVEKRDAEGLSRDEATELAKLMAEREGKEYEGNAENPPLDVEVERVGGGEEGVTEEDIERAEEVKEAEKTREAEKAEAGPQGFEDRPDEEDRADLPKRGSEGPPPA
jgi:hypothetical protein